MDTQVKFNNTKKSMVVLVDDKPRFGVIGPMASRVFAAVVADGINNKNA